MMGDISTAELAAALIAVFEGERLTSYQDSGGVWTIGLGHTKDVAAGQTITHPGAVNLFAQDMGPLLGDVHGLPLLEAGALASFGYNCGRGALRKVLDGHDLISSTAHTIDRKGNVLSGLRSRRRLEELLILISDQQSRKSA